MKETSKSNEGVSRMVLEETNGQLKRSENRIIELRERIKELSVNANENEESMNMEELRKKMDDKKSEETKVLRRLYLLLKQLKNSLKSECMIRVCEVLCQNGSVDINEECVERLSPFHNEMIYGLLLDYVKCVVCFIVK